MTIHTRQTIVNILGTLGLMTLIAASAIGLDRWVF
jgi:hypothetical protein